MRARSSLAIVLYVLGLIALIYAGLNFNNLFFVQKLMAKSDIPAYSRLVFIPILAAVLVLLDGSFIANLKRASSGVLYVLGNSAWLYSFYSLYEKMAIPVNEIDAYRSIFYVIASGVVLFVVGVILNDIPKRQK